MMNIKAKVAMAVIMFNRLKEGELISIVIHGTRCIADLDHGLETVTAILYLFPENPIQRR